MSNFTIYSYSSKVILNVIRLIYNNNVIGMEYEFQESSEQCSASQSARITAIQQSNETVITLSPSGFSKGFYQVSLVFPVACNNTNNSTCQSPQLNSAVGVELKYSPSLPSLTLQLDSQSLVTGQPVLLYNGQIENVVSLTLRSQSSAVSQSTVRFIKSPTVQSLNGLAVLDLQSNSLRPLGNCK